MIQTVEREAENQRNYDRLMVALEASQGKLDLLIVVCNDPNLEESVIQRYGQELQQQGIAHYRAFVQRRNASLRHTLDHLVQRQADLRQGGAVTVQGLNDLLKVRLGAATSEQEQLFGYLQWTREALRDFNFPVVIWVNQALLAQLAQKSPDFWSWRGGVFWFADQTGFVEPPAVAKLPEPEPSVGLEPQLASLLALIEQIEQQQGRNAPPLADLYDQLAELYRQRTVSSSNRQFAIQAYQRAIQLQRQLAAPAELAKSLEQLGNLYFERRDNANQALTAYQEAIGLFREVGSRLGEANTLQAIGDVLQFLDRRNEALSHYEQAIGLFREVGFRLGEANTLKAIGDVLQFLKRSNEALSHYEQAIGLYREVEDRLGEANTLRAIGDVLQFLDRRNEALSHYEQAIGLYREVGARLGEANVLQEFGKMQPEPQAGLDYLQQAQAIYTQIGDQYSQSRNLLFIASYHRQLQNPEAAIASLQQAAALASAIGYQPFQDYALNQIAELQQP